MKDQYRFLLEEIHSIHDNKKHIIYTIIYPKIFTGFRIELDQYSVKVFKKSQIVGIAERRYYTYQSDVNTPMIPRIIYQNWELTDDIIIALTKIVLENV